MEKASEISSTIVSYLLENCECPYSLEYVINARLFCGSDESTVIYQSNLLNTDGQTALDLLTLIQAWAEEGPEITVFGVTREVDPYCLVNVTDVNNADDCVPLVPTTAESTMLESTRPSHFTAAIAGGVAGGVATVLVVLVLAVVLYMCRSGVGVKHIIKTRTNL